MQTNKWQAFLSDPELNDNQAFHRPPEGKYLFGKILHDVLECLNNFTAILSLLVSSNVDISKNILHWFTSKKSAIESIITEINPLWRHHEELHVSSNEWPELIQTIGSKLDDVPKIVDEFNALKISLNGLANDLVTMAIANLRGLSVINAEIEAEEYKRLWTTRKYR